MRVFKFIALFLLLPSLCFAWCKVYEVKKDDSYKTISKSLLDDAYYYRYFEGYNGGKKLTPGEKLPFFIPKSEWDFNTGCRNVITIRMAQKKAHKQMESFLDGILGALSAVAMMTNSSHIDPVLGLDMCQLSLAFAEVTTDYGRKDKRKRTDGVFGFKDTVTEEILTMYNLMEGMEEAKLSPRKLINENVGDAALIFVLHIAQLFKEHKLLTKVLLKYFDDVDHEMLASRVYSAYLDILKIKPYLCFVEDAND